MNRQKRNLWIDLPLSLDSFCSIESHPTVDGEFIVTGTAPDAPRALWEPPEPRVIVLGPFASGIASAVFSLSCL